jgi:hypothetical protein
MRVRILPPTHPPAIEAGIATKLEAMRRAYETASNKDERTYHLLGALVLCTTFRPLPNWLFKALKAELVAKLPKKPDRHGVRYLLVLEGKRLKGTWAEGYGYARGKLEGTPYAGESRTMRESYQLFRDKLRGKRRQPRKRRR